MMIFIIVLAVIVLWAIYAYNHFVSLINKTAEAWSDIDVQLKRRYDLVPNLVSTVKGYATHEKEAFDQVTRARASAMSVSATGTLAEKGQAEGMLAAALKSVFAIAEAYPELKANQNFLSLQSQLAEIEEHIQASRRFYNGNVRDLNTSIQSFPSNLIARIFNFSSKEFFQLDNEAARNAVPVSF